MKIRKLSGFWEKTIGLSFKKKIEPVYFETRWGIHTFFVRDAIDVIICDDGFVVKKIKRNLKPFRILLWNPKYFRVFEFPAGSKNIRNIKIGDNFTPHLTSRN